MKLTARLAFRTTTASPTTPTVRSTREGPPPVSGFEHHVFRYALGAPLGAAGDAPPGFELLTLPSAAVVGASLGPLGGSTSKCVGAVPQSPPAIAVDLETSGLDPIHSVPYIVCAAWHEGDAIVIEQWTLRNARCERAFLRSFVARLAEVAGGNSQLVSFNGRCFDVPRLRVRLTRLGLPDGVLDRPHVDLVGPARRLYRGLHQDCRLTTLERRVLGVHRRGDLSGAEVAAVWEQLQAQPEDPWVLGELRLAQVHNRADLLSLFALMRSMASVIAAPPDLATAVRVARHWLGLGQVGRARAAVEPHAVALASDTAADAAALDALLMLGDLRRRCEAFDEAAWCWQAICVRWPGHPTAHDALAKHLEHRARRPAAALEVAVASGDPCPRRIARLRAKVGPDGELRASV